MTEFTFFGTDARFHHVGLAVKSIREVCPTCEIFVEETQKVSLAFILLNGIRVELLEPLGVDSPIAGSMARGARLLHLCYEVPDLEAALKLCRPAGFHRLGPPVPTSVFANQRLVWVFSKQFGLFELLEANRSTTLD